MVNQTVRSISRDQRNTTENPALIVGSYSNGLISLPANTDEVIATLSNAKENRRARQVIEWERMRRRTFRSRG